MKKTLFTIISLITSFTLLVSTTYATAIARDSAATGDKNGSSTSPFNGPIYNNVAGTVCIIGTFFNVWPSPITGVTYGGQAATLVTNTRTNNANDEGVAIWYINLPPMGSNQVVVTFTGTRYIDAAIQCYTNAQVVASPAYGSTYGNSAATTATVIMTDTNSWMVTYLRKGTGTCDTASDPPNERLTCLEAATSMFDSGQATGITGTYNMGTTGIGTAWSHASVEVSPYTAGAAAVSGNNEVQIITED